MKATNIKTYQHPPMYADFSVVNEGIRIPKHITINIPPTADYNGDTPEFTIRREATIPHKKDYIFAFENEEIGASSFSMIIIPGYFLNSQNGKTWVEPIPQNEQENIQQIVTHYFEQLAQQEQRILSLDSIFFWEHKDFR